MTEHYFPVHNNALPESADGYITHDANYYESEKNYGKTPQDSNKLQQTETVNDKSFEIGGVSFEYKGRTPTGQLLTSVAGDGLERQILVYLSQSGGSNRVSQGFESRDGLYGRRLMKGRELSHDPQYTQDTQLHPLFAEKIGLIEESNELSNQFIATDRVFNAAEAEILLKDFEKQTEVIPLGNAELDSYLRTFRANEFEENTVFQMTGHNPRLESYAVKTELEKIIRHLNNLIIKANIMPNFASYPKSTSLSEHPILGDMVRDTYEVKVGHKVHQWVMAHDLHGRAWIERIRLADAKISPYGTDKQLLYSGVLTSKPVDYKWQESGLPIEWRPVIGSGYVDISTFLKKLIPIEEYSKHYAQRDEHNHFI